MVSRIIIFVLLSTTLLLADTKSDLERLFRQASSGEIRFTKLVQPSKDSLSAKGAVAAKFLVSKLATTDAREAQTLTEIYRGIGKKATPFLIGALKTDDKYQLRTTCRCLEEVKDSRAIDALLKVASHSDYTVRSGALTAIGKSGGGATTAARLEPFIRDSIAVVRKSCVAGLGILKAPSSVDLLIRALTDLHFSVRLTAYDALVAYDSLAATPIVALLDSVKNPATTSLAIRLAGRLHLRQSQQRVERYLSSDDPMLRGWAVWSWGRLLGREARGQFGKLRETESDLFVKSQLDETTAYLDTLTSHE
jgi:hypothetical protein